MRREPLRAPKDDRTVLWPILRDAALWAAVRMTAECGGRAQRPYSAGLAAGGGGAAEGGVPAAELAAAAFFSTIRTAMIEPS